MIFIFFRKTIFSLSNNTQPFLYDLPPFWHPPPICPFFRSSVSPRLSKWAGGGKYAIDF